MFKKYWVIILFSAQSIAWGCSERRIAGGLYDYSKSSNAALRLAARGYTTSQIRNINRQRDDSKIKEYRDAGDYKKAARLAAISAQKEAIVLGIEARASRKEEKRKEKIEKKIQEEKRKRLSAAMEDRIARESRRAAESDTHRAPVPYSQGNCVHEQEKPAIAAQAAVEQRKDNELEEEPVKIIWV